MEVGAGTDCDLVTIDGESDALLDGVLEVVLLDGFVLAPEATFDVLTADAIALGANFLLDETRADLPPAWYFTAEVFLTLDGQSLRLTVVPEPSTLVSLGVALTGPVARVWRKRRRQHDSRESPARSYFRRTSDPVVAPVESGGGQGINVPQNVPHRKGTFSGPPSPI